MPHNAVITSLAVMVS